MSGHSTYLADKLLNWLKGTTMGAAPATTYCALFNGDPTDAGSGGTEVTTTIEAAGRQAITWGAPSGKIMSNSADVDFGNADAGATITHIAIFDAATVGNMLGSFALSPSRVVTTGDPVKFSVGDLIWDDTTP
jgi:hypothetical protein